MLGMVAGPALGSAVVGLSLSAPFIIYAAALVIVVMLVYFGLRRSTLLDVADEHHGTPVRLTSALRHRTFLAALMSNFSAGWAIFGIRGALLPLLVVEALHQRPGAAGLVFAAFAAGDVSTAFWPGRGPMTSVASHWWSPGWWCVGPPWWRWGSCHRCRCLSCSH